jgi:hypothetical protein
MSPEITNPLAVQYLKQLRAGGRALPRNSRDDLVQQIEDHLRDAIPEGASDTDARAALDRLGTPRTIVAAEAERLGVRLPAAGGLEWSVVFLLPLGGVIIPVLGWVLAVFLLWISKVWTVRDKLIGTLLVPGGLASVAAVALLASTTTSCSGTGSPGHTIVSRCTSTTPAVPDAISVPLLAFLVIASIATPLFLAVRARASRAYV